MGGILSGLWRIIVWVFNFIIRSFKGLPGTWPYAVISAFIIFCIAVVLFWIWMAIDMTVSEIRYSAKESRKNRAEKAERKAREEEERKKTPQQKFDEAVKAYDNIRYSSSYKGLYSGFKALIGKVDGADEYAEKCLRGWYRHIEVEADSFLKNGKARASTGDYCLKEMEWIMHELVSQHLLSAGDWVKEMADKADKLVPATQARHYQEAADEARERAEEAAAEAAYRELRGLEDEDAGSSSTGAYDSVDLSVLPDMLFFTGDPDTVYQHYGYMTGGLGQRVRVYMSLDGSRKVSFSWAHTGFLNDGRTFSTDQGTVERYGF